MRYFDKNGKEIKAGMTLKHEDGSLELVYACGEDDLGFNASNLAWLKRTGQAQEFYPLYQFSLTEWEIVDNGS